MTLQWLFEWSVHASVNYMLNQLRSPDIIIRLRNEPGTFTYEFLGCRTLI